jgi:acetyl-CoA acyltransferase 2
VISVGIHTSETSAVNMAVARATKGIFLVAARRTPIGAFGGKLSKYSATDLQEVAFRAALASANLDPALVDSVVVGNVSQVTKDASYISRHAALRVGVREEVGTLHLNRMCGSGFQSVVTAAQEILLGDADIVLTGGAESMSLAPHNVWGARFGVPLGTDLVMVDSLWQGLIDQHIQMPMGITAENLAEKYDISREDCDNFAIRSQQFWKAANDAGYFKEEIVPMEIKTRKGKVTMDTDEHPKPQNTFEQLSKLPAVFKKGGTVNAGNASGICDGASSIIVASEEACTKHNLQPIARLAGYGIAGCDPKIMGIGPVPAIKQMLLKTGKFLQDIDLIEVNEAFAAQCLAVQKVLGIDPDKFNLNCSASCSVG